MKSNVVVADFNSLLALAAFRVGADFFGAFFSMRFHWPASYLLAAQDVRDKVDSAGT